MTKQILFTFLALIPASVLAQATCPFSEAQCVQLAKAKCVISQDKWKCDDGDQFEFDEGLWRTEQIEILRTVLPQLSEHPSKASLQLEYDQIRMTGLWQDGKFMISINRSQNSMIEVTGWWTYKDGSPTGIWFPFQTSFQGPNLDWGAGIYNSGKLEMDLRVVKGDGGKVSMQIIQDDVAKFEIYTENQYGSNSTDRATLKRVREGSLGDKLLGFRKSWTTGNFNGKWQGEVQVDNCMQQRTGRRKYELSLRWNNLYLEVLKKDITETKPETIYNQYWRLMHYEFVSDQDTQYTFTPTLLEVRSHNEQYGADSHMRYELSPDGKTMKILESSSMFGGGMKCNIEGTLTLAP